MSEITPEQVRKHICPFDNAYCPEFQRTLDAWQQYATMLSNVMAVRFNGNMFVNPGKEFFKKCPKTETPEDECMRYKVWLYNKQHIK